MLAIFDLHCDTPFYLQKNKTKHVKPSRLYEQGYTGAVFAHFVYPKAKDPFVDAVKMISATFEHVEPRRNLHLVRKYRDMVRSKANILMGVEGGHIYDSVFGQVEALYGLGVRVFTVTWNNSNRLAHSALDDDKKGLTSSGRAYVRKLRKYGVILDMSHASTRTVLDVCEIYDGGIIASHSCVRALNPSFPRNISDPAIDAIFRRGGVVGVNFSKYHLGRFGIADHLDYLCEKYGVACAAIGSDFDGINDPAIPGPGRVARVEKTLLVKGYKKSDIQKIFSGNFLKLLKRI
jgi:membrane dipeptidase